MSIEDTIQLDIKQGKERAGKLFLKMWEKIKCQ